MGTFIRNGVVYGGYVVDSALDTTSENAIQNKAVATAINQLKSALSNLTNMSISRKITLGNIPSDGNIVSITVTQGGTYLILLNVNCPAWFKGVIDTTSVDYHALQNQAFIRQCSANEILTWSNKNGEVRNYQGDVVLVKLP